jgi:calcium binding protein 39
MRTIMFGGGEDDAPPDAELQTALALETAKPSADGTGNVTAKLIEMLPKLFFETRKDAAAVFNAIVRHPIGSHEDLPHVQYLNENPQLLRTIVEASELGEEMRHGNNAASLTYGTMLREVARYEALCRHILFSDAFLKMFDYMQLTTFELASDAAASFRELLTRHKSLAAEALETRFDVFFNRFNAMLENGNYVTRRQSLKLLSELLLDRSNAGVMMRYIGSVENMCLMMNLLRDDARSIQFEAFHVFKVFVANPNKSAQILSILQKNREKLVAYLAAFQNDREDEQFAEEKAMLTRLLERMAEPGEEAEGGEKSAGTS